MALSCAEAEPIDWAHRLPAAGAAVIGVVESVTHAETDAYVAELTIRVRATEYLQGRLPAALEYSTANFGAWGPYYEIGPEIAIPIEDGEVTDGQMNICGPWFSPDELRVAAADYSITPDVEPRTLDQLVSLLNRLLQLVFGWFG